MLKGRKAVLFGILGIIFYMAATGCIPVTVTAKDELYNRVSVKTPCAVKAIYIESYDWDFHPFLKESIEKDGYAIVSDSKSADLTITANAHYYRKEDGTVDRFLFFIPATNIFSDSESETVDGIDVDVIYRSKCGQSYKQFYRAYRQRFEGNVISAILDDIRIISKGN